MKKEDIETIQGWICEPNSLKRVVISGKRKSHHPRYERIDIRPVLIKDELLLQVVAHDGKKDITKNFAFSKFNVADYLNEGYANILIERLSEKLTIRITKQGDLQIHRAQVEEESEPNLSHDRSKRRVLPISDPVFKALGITDSRSELIPRQSDKYRQVDDFLRIIESEESSLGAGPISIVDLGCGNAYLTFAAYRYLTNKGHAVKVVGVDSKTESRARNSKIALDLSLSDDLEFVDSTISEFPNREVDLVIALHACDTATDDALAWAVKSRAKVVLVSPCCHHQLNKEIKAKEEAAEIIFRHGIMKERFADLLTDSLRAEIMKLHGYRSEIFEFVSLDHTPRNLMIRAVFNGIAGERSKYESICAKWQINPYLAQLLD